MSAGLNGEMAGAAGPPAAATAHVVSQRQSEMEPKSMRRQHLCGFVIGFVCVMGLLLVITP